MPGKKFLRLPLSARESQRRATVRKAYSDEEFGRLKSLCARLLVRGCSPRFSSSSALRGTKALCCLSSAGFHAFFEKGESPHAHFEMEEGPRPSLMSFLKTNADRVGPLNDSDIVFMGK